MFPNLLAALFLHPLRSLCTVQYSLVCRCIHSRDESVTCKNAVHERNMNSSDKEVIALSNTAMDQARQVYLPEEKSASCTQLAQKI